MSNPSIQIRPGILAKIKSLHDVPSDEVLAGMIGVDRHTLARINKGASPSAAFIAGTIVATRLPFDAIFTVKVPA